MISDIIEYDLEDIILGDSSGIFSDPESEWTGTIKVDEPEDEPYTLQPESEQNEEISRAQRKDGRIRGSPYDKMYT